MWQPHPRPLAPGLPRRPWRSESLRTPAHVARGLRALRPWRGPMAGPRVAAASARPPRGEMRHRQPVSHLMIYWCVSSPRTDGHAADRTRQLGLPPPVGLGGETPADASQMALASKGALASRFSTLYVRTWTSSRTSQNPSSPLSACTASLHEKPGNNDVGRRVSGQIDGKCVIWVSDDVQKNPSRRLEGG